jgi:hypothetical protein
VRILKKIHCTTLSSANPRGTVQSQTYR